ncbi:ROK family protein [Lactobacillus corticis]|uniref:Transcriptional regulator / sugar kinase NagC n=1 Tax=Lactobacillus corticis TaxID=2201249 RepID=A0A916VIU8_9LACO|nr:ROK family protein [Lactobacillus corticis]GFZ26369.1 transcriptional regulator / sugar kinase NagC [Lactobacillus corticis]
MAKDYLAIDVGGTNIKYGILNRSGKLISRGSVKSDCHNLAEFYALLDKIVAPNLKRIRAIAVCVPGKVDLNTGIVYFGGALPFLHGAKIKEYLEERYGLLTGVENDGKAAALAELWMGSLHDVPNGAVIVLGTLVGGGIVVNHQLIHGSNFQAGELSFMLDHFKEKADGSANRYVGYDCSAVGMIEKIATALNLPDKKDGRAAFAAIKSGQPEAVAIFQSYCYQIAQLIMNLQAVIDSERIAIGGGISSEAVLIEEIKRQYQKLLAENPILAQTFTPPEIVPCHFHSDANLYGSLYALLNEWQRQLR